MAEHWIKTWNRLNIEYNDFLRTTEDRHKNLVLEFTSKVRDKKISIKEIILDYFVMVVKHSICLMIW